MNISNCVLQREALSKEVNKQNQHTQSNKHKTRKTSELWCMCLEKCIFPSWFYPLSLFLDLTVSQAVAARNLVASTQLWDLDYSPLPWLKLRCNWMCSCSLLSQTLNALQFFHCEFLIHTDELSSHFQISVSPSFWTLSSSSHLRLILSQADVTWLSLENHLLSWTPSFNILSVCLSNACSTIE